MADVTLPSTGFPSPSEVPEFWRSCVLGPFLIPSDPRFGSCTVKVSPGVDVDNKKPKGKDKGTKTVTGKKDAKVTVSVEFSSRIWPEMQVAIEALLPNGTPVDIASPNTMIHKIGSVMILSVSDGVQWDGGKGTYSWECEEWTSPSGDLGRSLILRRGSTGAEVSRWQTFLSGPVGADSSIPAVAIDGIFGLETETATKEFQAEEQITVDGIVGPETFGAASKYGYVPPPPVKGGSSTKTPGTSRPAAETEGVNPGHAAADDEGVNPWDPEDALTGVSDP